jgi:hypothetical protein
MGTRQFKKLVLEEMMVQFYANATFEYMVVCLTVLSYFKEKLLNM